MAADPTSSAPLADYFFIAGIESSRIFDSRQLFNGAVATSPRLESTIEEGSPEHTPIDDPQNSNADSPGPAQRHKRFSWDARKSIGSIAGLDSKVSASNRSSATIRAIPQGSSSSEGFSEEDFDQALKKFAADRDSVIAEIQFTAGQLPQPSKPAPVTRRPKTQRFTNDDLLSSPKSGMGSVKRRLSTMNPLSRSGTSRRASARMSKRLSGYNSVIPTPKRFSLDAGVHPLKRPYEPVLLDQYPTKDMVDEPQKRKPFPDYVPMFVFPNDVNVVSSDEKPRPTWHGFAMTTADGSRLYGITLIIWLPLKPDAAEELERQCEDWRRRNMTNEERELANSLGERLATERARMSELLEQLAESAGNEVEREQKEDELNITEEKIAMMTDMLRPVRHGAASKIEGLTDGDNGLWIPRAYGVLGRDPDMTSFWKEWLRVIATPMANGAILRVPPSSPRVGTWQPLERYVVNLCAEALSPITSKTQVELAIRELRLYARKEAINEIPGSRNTDLYALFRSLDVPVIVTLFEFVLAESRIILLSSHTSMLHLASAALVQLLYPFKWAAVFIPVLPARLIQALEAPCPYIVGIERRYENVDIPDDDIVLVDLDNGTIEASGPPPPLPRPQRRKLISLLQLAAPHKYRFGVPVGPPSYAMDAFPHDVFSSENAGIFTANPPASTLAQLAGLNSTSFGANATSAAKRPPMFNVFSSARNSSHGSDRPSTSSTNKPGSPPSPTSSPMSSTFPASVASNGSRNDAGQSLQASLKEKRSGMFDGARRNSSLGMDRMNTARRPSVPFAGAGHHSAASVSTLNTDYSTPSGYAPSTYAQSSMAASTIMPQALMQPVKNTKETQYVEGHCMHWNGKAPKTTCSICSDRADDGVYKCTGCGTVAHARCVPMMCLVCPAAFFPDQIFAAFVRCFASLLYTYRKYMVAAPRGDKSGKLFQFNKDAFMRSLPHDAVEYTATLVETQAFNEFIAERETKRHDDPSMRLFDEIILSKRNRGRSSMFSKSHVNFLADTSNHLWRSAAAPTLSTRGTGSSQAGVGRAPAKLDPSLLKEPRVVYGAPRIGQTKPRRKQVPSMLGSVLRSQSSPAEA